MQDATNTAICPLCRHPVGSDRRCLNSRCGETLDTGNWALSAAYGTEGLLPPDVPDGPWRLPELSARTTDAARIVSPLPLSLRPENGVHDIGASIECHVRLAGLATDRAVSLHFHRPTQTWWAFDWCRDSGATINGERFRNRRLKDNDILGVAGAKLRYRSGVLSAEYGTTDGVDISISGLTDARQSRSDPPRPLLDRISFVIPDGEFVGIIGPSGCGKSTLLSIVAGMIRPTYGRVLLQGEPIEGISPHIGYMLQRDNLLEWRNIYRNVVLGLEIRKKLTKENEEYVQGLLKAYGLWEFRDKYPSQLSGGMRQRAALIRTLAVKPDIFLLDEAFSALDYQTRLAVTDDVRRILKLEQKTTLMVTHDIAESISMSDRIIVLSRRPAHISRIMEIPFDNPELTPLQRREQHPFQEYFNTIWRELDVHV